MASAGLNHVEHKVHEILDSCKDRAAEDGEDQEDRQELRHEGQGLLIDGGRGCDDRHDDADDHTDK